MKIAPAQGIPEPNAIDVRVFNDVLDQLFRLDNHAVERICLQLHV